VIDPLLAALHERIVDQLVQQGYRRERAVAAVDAILGKLANQEEPT
jgi:hypothetical protein